ncbi:tRNA pseudouridine(55) synthase TruB [Candidatus Kaiserbacteria bacterium RIFCSPLOWO2_02_FULL_45_11b]|uniref:tRNA pseudouridine synthase B n=1 Tax=Candidatus Kaiserbacteria bacterium RIFCSPLOWO2_12_FULL_45_26 TaxID=1798525 RepID=A0A1F6FH19_9BACT|nr:MAG: tRNA pseudouridine(55) synthase TruB [Candidatus Kaiserbacteria bacterium RIFCSPHIGHO2_12_45_16]OGG69995.1 MAG: tRNA pseudouridine(55) synthase TruB [Candidatus Kaiserbacteria bacterium RIFCSPLOWO2_01_FULL_45_25]OGG83664.1 MAG: tRNA pseudouridine(55) synthase TruB [Candidatus Kaiserbacteria bacterium RIFCSPLOWO2_02_FULL_45_11b]OGG85155.1 MAG: tRNA pseudouridine(55) synthase TruB [Candidatus Kaiserbacteria bacterium RIFCSPLOWO2_12_FULL_45_26]
MSTLPELLLIDKPKGISSFTVIRQLRRKTGVRKMGHAGTLDPLASGLMLIGVEKGTKKLTGLVGLDKEYVASILLGEQRSTGDMEGEILAERSYAGDVSKEAVLEALRALEGEVELPVSAYSAIKKDGMPMYKRARKAAAKGEVVIDVPRRVMKVYETELLEIKEIETENGPRLEMKVRFKVGSGTYIRSLAEEVGRLLGYPAVMSDLRRTKVGEYRIEDAKRLEEFDTLAQRLLNKLKFW